MTETPTPKPREAHYPPPLEPGRLLGYPHEYVEKLREGQCTALCAEVERERDEAIARAESAEVALTDLRAERDEAIAKLDHLPTDDAIELIAEREPWRVLRAASDVVVRRGHDPNVVMTVMGIADHLTGEADRLEREHAETAKRDGVFGALESAAREAVESVADVFMAYGLIDERGRSELVGLDFTEAIGAAVEQLLAGAGDPR